MRLREIITEGADAPLFHATSPDALASILRDDLIRPTGEPHPLPRAFRRGGRPADWRHPNVVFLTRSFEFAQSWQPCVLVLHQARLRHRYKVRPFDPIALRRSLDHHKSEITGSVANRRWMVGRWDDEPIAFPWDEQVEMVEGTISPLTRYLLSIHVPAWTMNELSPDDANLVRNHPAYDKPYPGKHLYRRFG